MQQTMWRRVYASFLKSVAIPMVERWQEMPVQREMARLLRSQWWAPEQLRALQHVKLRRIIRHAYTHAPYYRCMMQARGLRPDDIRTVEDLDRLPILTKAELRRVGSKQFLAQNLDHRSLVRLASSGSTGEPFDFYLTRYEKALKWASLFRYWTWAGFDFGQPYVTIDSAPHLAFKDNRLLGWVEQRVTRLMPIVAFDVYNEYLPAVVDWILAFRPVFIRGYAASIQQIAEYLRDTGRHLPLSAVLTTGETLLPDQRALLEERFECRVFDGYGGEGMEIGFECEAHSGYHINAEALIVEVVDEQGLRLPPGERGQIVLTELDHFAMPFIRYNIQDLGTLSARTCTCGRGLPLLDSIEGRLTDELRMPNGERMVVQFFTRLAKRLPGIQHFQVAQTAREQLVIRVVPNGSFKPEVVCQMQHEVRDYTRGAMHVEVEVLDQIPLSRSGKRRLLVREMGDDVA